MRKILLAASAIAGFAAVSAGNANAQMPITRPRMLSSTVV